MKEKKYAGAFERNGISGVSLASGNDVAGIRLAFPHVSLGLCDDQYLLYLLRPGFMGVPGQKYTSYSFNLPMTEKAVRKIAKQPIISVNCPMVTDFSPDEIAVVTLEWRFSGNNYAEGKYSSDRPVKIGIFVNSCFNPQHGKVLKAGKSGIILKHGKSVLACGFSGKTELPFLIDSREEAENAWHGLIKAEGKKMALYPVTVSPQNPLYFKMELFPAGSAGLRTSVKLNPGGIDRELSLAEKQYKQERMKSTGICAGGAEAVASLGVYGRAYDPARRRIQMTVNRTWCGPNSSGGVFGWDNFFCAYLATLEDPNAGRDAIEHIVSVFGEKHIVHSPTQRNLIIPIIYVKTMNLIGDPGLVRKTWPVMMRFMKFWFENRGDGHPWRDGNDDGLIESGSNADIRQTSPGGIIQNAMDETGYDEIPIYSAGFTNRRLGMPRDKVYFDWKRRTLTVTEVGQNGLYIASCKAMATIAKELGFAEENKWLLKETARVAQRMNEVLFSRKSRIYLDRFWDGSFSNTKTMTLFFPLLAGIASNKTAVNLKNLLLDSNKFWGENLMPTVSRDDESYCDGIDGNGNYWRGNCWPPATYMTWLSIKEAGWSEVSAEFARRTSVQFLEYWNRFGHAYENYPPEGKVNHSSIYPGNWGGREIRYIWAALNPVCALEEVFSPENDIESVRFGNPYLAKETSWKGFFWKGNRMEASTGPGKTEVTCGKKWHFISRPGAVIREFRQTAYGWTFKCISKKGVSISFSSASLPEKAKVILDGKEIPCRISKETISCKVSAGVDSIHLISIVFRN